MQVHSPVRWPGAAAGAVRADSPCCCLLSVFRAGNRRKLAHIFCGLQEAIKCKRRLPGRAAGARRPRVRLNWGARPRTSSRMARSRCGTGLPLCSRRARQPGSQHRALGPAKACPVFGGACNSYSDREHNTEKYGDQDHDISQ